MKCVWATVDGIAQSFPFYGQDLEGKTCLDILEKVKSVTGQEKLSKVWLKGSECFPDDLILDLVEERVSTVLIGADESTPTSPAYLTIQLYLNTSIDGILDGFSLEVPSNLTSEDMAQMIHECFVDDPKTNLEVDVYLPGALPFVEETIRFHLEKKPVQKYNFYGVVHRKAQDKDTVLSMQDFARVSSPLCQSSPFGASQMWAFLLLVRLQQDQIYQLISRLASNYRFGPLITGLFALWKGWEVTKRKLLAITSTLQTIITGTLSLEPVECLDHTLECLSAIAKVMVSTSREFILLDSDPELIKRYHENEENGVVVWAPDVNGVNVNPMVMKEVKSSDVLSIFESTYFLRPIELYGLCKAKFPCISKKGDIVLCTGNGEDVTLIHMNKTSESMQLHNQFCMNMDAADLNLGISRENVAQIICFCIDRSSICASRGDQLSNLLEAYHCQSYRFRSGTIHGALSFSDSVSLTSEFSTVSDRLFTTQLCDFGGESHLYDAISASIDALYAFNSTDAGPYYLEAKLRVVVLATGKDTGSLIQHGSLYEKAQNANVLIDAVIFEPPENELLQKLCHVTGGSCVFANSDAKIKEIVESEAFLAASYRHIITSEDGSLDAIFPNLYTVRGNRTQKLLSALEASKRAANLEQNNRRKRIFQEMKQCSTFDDPAIVISFTETFDDWRAFIKGPDGTPYQNKWFYLLISFPDEYPRTPPSIRFHSVPFHCNISKEGRICANLLSTDYQPGYHITELLAVVLCLLSEPNYNDPIEHDKIVLYQKDPAEFQRKARESADVVGKNSVEEWKALIEGHTASHTTSPDRH